jgi:aerotaxis receptor
MDQVEKQSSELEQVATAMNEMVASISEVSMSAVSASDMMTNVRTMVDDGCKEVERTRDCIDALKESLSSASTKIQDVSTSSHTISELVNSIHSIAEQTNLLALNAAIEAARAGEQGRGFAVVADEVRNLASNTATTTEQIQLAIAEISSDVSEAVRLMKNAEAESSETENQSERAREVLDAIHLSTNDTSDAVTQIAAAAEEQSAVSEEINRGIHHIQSASIVTRENMHHAQEAYEKLYQEVSKLRVVTEDFSSSVTH